MAEQDAQAVAPSAAPGGRGTAQLLIPLGERAAVITGGDVLADGAGLVRGLPVSAGHRKWFQMSY